MVYGYLYAADIGNGEIKIGRSRDPKARMKAYEYEGYSLDLSFITPEEVEDAGICERRICYLLREKHHRGREFFKCSLAEAISVIKKVYGESIEGRLEEEPETETVTFTNLNQGIKKIMIEAARERGHDTTRQLFMAWVQTLNH